MYHVIFCIFSSGTIRRPILGSHAPHPSTCRYTNRNRPAPLVPFCKNSGLMIILMHAKIAIFSGVLMILPKFSTDNLSRNVSDSCFQKKNIERTHLAMGTRSDQLPEVRCRTTFTEAAGRCTQELPARLRASSRLIQ